MQRSCVADTTIVHNHFLPMTTATLTRFEMDLSDELVPYLEREDLIKLADELSNYGVETIEQFQDSFYFRADSPDAIDEFVDHIIEEVWCCELPPFIVVDREATWRSALCFDFFTIDVNGETFFFHNYF